MLLDIQVAFASEQKAVGYLLFFAETTTNPFNATLSEPSASQRNLTLFHPGVRRLGGQGWSGKGGGSNRCCTLRASTKFFAARCPDGIAMITPSSLLVTAGVASAASNDAPSTLLERPLRRRIPSPGASKTMAWITPSLLGMSLVVKHTHAGASGKMLALVF